MTNTLKSRVLMYRPELAKFVKAGVKTSTVRGTPKRPIVPGVTKLDHRQWEAKPYRSKQIKLKQTDCKSCKDIKIGETGWLSIDHQLLNDAQRKAFAQAEGFKTYGEFLTLFRSLHELPFAGVVITW